MDSKTLIGKFWQIKIDSPVAKFTNVFRCQHFVLYSISLENGFLLIILWYKVISLWFQHNSTTETWKVPTYIGELRMFARDTKFFFDFLASLDVCCHIHNSRLIYLRCVSISIPYPSPIVVSLYLWCDLYILIVGSSYDVESMWLSENLNPHFQYKLL